jgi:hypothetical protein
MATSSDALFSCLLEDLSPYISRQDLDILHREEKVPLISELGIKRNAATQLANAFYAKYVGTAPGKTGERLAFEKFEKMNLHCKNFRPETISRTSWDDELYGEFKKLLYSLFYPHSDSTIEMHHVLSEARNGPGSAVGSFGSDSYTKLFASRGGTTSMSLFQYFKYFFSHDCRWTDAENLRSASFGDPELVEGSKISFVPKNREIMRSICSEPSLNMFYQLGLGSVLEQRLKAFTGIDLAVQPDRNRELALQGSVDGSFATIDLASASDTISLNLLADCLPRGIYALLCKLRCKKTAFDGQFIDLHMVSTMGNGFTFPLMTSIFACALLAVYRVYGIPVDHPFRSRGNYGVFGDDIVCVAKAFRPLCSFLERLGFFVNGGKSFNEGPFRESCGVDFFSGVNIRGVYCKTLDTPQALTVLVNRLNDWTARTGIPVWRTAGYLADRCRFNPVPLCENDDAGVRVPLDMVVKVKRDPHVQAIRYEKWVAKPVHLTVDPEQLVIRSPRGEKQRIYNPVGLGLVFLLRYIRSGKKDPDMGLCSMRIGLRNPEDSVRYERRRTVIPYWDFLPTSMGTKNPLRPLVLSFPEAVRANLG